MPHRAAVSLDFSFNFRGPVYQLKRCYNDAVLVKGHHSHFRFRRGGNVVLTSLESVLGKPGMGVRSSVQEFPTLARVLQCHAFGVCSVRLIETAKLIQLSFRIADPQNYIPKKYILLER